MKAFELREMTREELDHKLRELKEEYFNLKMQHSVSPIANPNRFSQIRKDIARIKTIQNERELEKEE